MLQKQLADARAAVDAVRVHPLPPAPRLRLRLLDLTDSVRAAGAGVAAFTRAGAGTARDDGRVL
jgi:hypothetical protein